MLKNNYCCHGSCTQHTLDHESCTLSISKKKHNAVMRTEHEGLFIMRASHTVLWIMRAAQWPNEVPFKHSTYWNVHLQQLTNRGITGCLCNNDSFHFWLFCTQKSPKKLKIVSTNFSHNVISNVVIFTINYRCFLTLATKITQLTIAFISW